MSTLTRALRSLSRPPDWLRRRPWHRGHDPRLRSESDAKNEAWTHTKSPRSQTTDAHDRHPKSAQSRNANAQSRNTDKSLTPMNSLISHQNETQAPSAHAARPIAVTHASRQGRACPLTSSTLHGVAEEEETRKNHNGSTSKLIVHREGYCTEDLATTDARTRMAAVALLRSEAGGECGRCR